MKLADNLLLRRAFNLSLVILLSSCSCNKKSHDLESLKKSESIDITYHIDDLLDEQNDDQNFDDENDSDLEFINYDSGLKCEILRQGPNDTKLPAQGQTLTVHYSCWYNDKNQPGKIISSSYDDGVPVELRVSFGNVIRAWDEALMDMRVGDKWRLYVPAELAFGSAGSDQLIPGDTDLIYDLELLEIK